MEESKHDSVWYKKKIEEIVKELHYTVEYALKPLGSLVLIKDGDGQTIVRVNRFPQRSAFREAYEQIVRYKEYLDSAKQESYGIYEYTGPDMILFPFNRGFHVLLTSGETDYFEYAIKVKAEVNINIATVKSIYNEHQGCWQEIDSVDVAAKYLTPVKEEYVKPETIDFTEDKIPAHLSIKDFISKYQYWGMPREEAEKKFFGEDHHEVGGDHYKMAIEPWDFIYANHIPFDEASAIKYLCRHKSKNGAEDVKKAISFCEHILKTQYGEEV